MQGTSEFDALLLERLFAEEGIVDDVDAEAVGVAHVGLEVKGAGEDGSGTIEVAAHVVGKFG